MPDENPENIVKILLELRELLREQNKISLQTAEEARLRALAQRRRVFPFTALLLLMAVAWFVYVFWITPRTDRRFQDQMDQIRSNYLSRPH